MATPADRFRLAQLAPDAASIPIDAGEDHPGVQCWSGVAT